MLPVHFQKPNVLKIGPYEGSLITGDVRVVPWPAFEDEYQLWDWHPLGYVPMPSGGLWVVGSSVRKHVRLLRLDGEGRLVGAITVDGTHGVSYDRHLAFGERVLVGNLFLRGLEVVRTFDQREPFLPFASPYPKAAMTPDGEILLADGTAIGTDGTVRQILNMERLLNQIREALQKNDLMVWLPAVYPLGIDRETLWLLVLEMMDVEAPPLVVAVFRRAGDGEWALQQVWSATEVECRLCSPLPNGGWAMELVPDGGDEMQLSVQEREWWFRLPGSDQPVFVSVPSLLGNGLKWEWTRVFGWIPGVGLLALGTGMTGDGVSVLAWAGDGQSGRVLRLMPRMTWDEFAGMPWWVVSSEGGGTATVFRCDRHKQLPPGGITLHAFWSALEGGEDFRPEQVFPFGDMFVLAVVHQDGRTTRLISGRMTAGGPQSIRELAIGGPLMYVKNARRTDDGIQLRLQIGLRKWNVFVGRDGTMHGHAE